MLTPALWSESSVRRVKSPPPSCMCTEVLGRALPPTWL